MPVKVGDCVGPVSMAVAQGLLYAAHNGASIINLSFGRPNCSAEPTYVQQAIQEAQRLGELIVAAAGNDGLSAVESPANLNHVLASGPVPASAHLPPLFSH